MIGIGPSTNFSAFNSNLSGLNSSAKKLSSGLKINSAADNAAGLSILMGLQSEVRGTQVASNNVGDGISMVNTAEAGLSAIKDDLQRIRDLKVQAENGTNGPDELAAIQSEIDTLKQNISDVAGNTEFNGQNLLDGSSGTVSLQTGSGNGDTTDVDLSGDFDAAGAGLNNGTAVSLDNVDVTTGTGSLDDIDAMIDNVSAAQAELGATANSLESKSEYLSVKSESASSSASRIGDTDFAKESSNFSKLQVLAKLGASVANVDRNIAASVLGMFG